MPAVIAVNSESEIMDKVCDIFSKYLYENLLNNQTVDQAFKGAKDLVTQAVTGTDVSNQDFTTCCCAHKHDEECSWYKYWLEEP